jgi:hypothetical protein
VLRIWDESTSTKKEGEISWQITLV